VNPSGNSSNQSSLWDLSNSFFFAGTVITTIGTKVHKLACKHISKHYITFNKTHEEDDKVDELPWI